MALMLALSMVVGMTGAWFTDSEAGSDNVSKNFGTINLAAVTDTYTTTRTVANSDASEDLMPGDTVAVTFAVQKSAATDEDMYYAFKLVVGGAGAAVLQAPATLTGYTYDSTSGAWYATAAIRDGNAVNVAVNYTIANSVGSTPTAEGTYQGAAVTFSLQVVAVQAANMADAAAAQSVLAGLFA